MMKGTAGPKTSGRDMYVFQQELESVAGVSWSVAESDKVKVKVSQLCPTLCNPMDYIVHGILQARILEWVVVPFFRGSSQPRY